MADVIQCDRCGCIVDPNGENIRLTYRGWLNGHRSEFNRDLCGDCRGAFDRFMCGADVGEGVGDVNQDDMR